MGYGPGINSKIIEFTQNYRAILKKINKIIFKTKSGLNCKICHCKNRKLKIQILKSKFRITDLLFAANLLNLL